MHKINDYPFLDSCQPVSNLCNHISAQHTHYTATLHCIVVYRHRHCHLLAHNTHSCLSHIENKHEGGVPTSTAHYPASKGVLGIITTTWIPEIKENQLQNQA